MKTLILSIFLLYSFVAFGTDGDKIVDATHCKGSELAFTMCIFRSVCTDMDDLSPDERFYIKIITQQKKTTFYLFEQTPLEFSNVCGIVGKELKI